MGDADMTRKKLRKLKSAFVESFGYEPSRIELVEHLLGEWHYVGRYRWKLAIESSGYHPDRGFGVMTSGGSLGGTYGKPGTNMARDVTVLAWVPIKLTIAWTDENRA